MSEFIRYTVDGQIGTITIDRPAKRNAITYAMLAALVNTFREAGADDRTRVVIFTGVPGAFCAGTDLLIWPRSREPSEGFAAKLVTTMFGGLPLPAPSQ